MENASKALTMAGGILISLLVIGLLVLFYNNIQSWQQIGQENDEVAQATEFNKQFDVYDREVYGSELLSLANKINDYNIRESNNKGYTKVELQVMITKKIGGNITEYFKTNPKKGYTAEDLVNQKKAIDDAIANKTYDYGTLKSLLTTVKATVFKNKEVKYDQNTGRIKIMTFEY